MYRSIRVIIMAGVCCVLTGVAAAWADKPDGKPSDRHGTVIDARSFSHPTVIENKWTPMKPGTQWTYEGTSVEDDGKVVPHRIIITITDLTKVVSGIRTIVSYDVDYTDGELVEAELAFYAQDNQGNVWQFGEYPEEYEDGKVIRAPAWIHGLRGSQAGMLMPANPRPGMPSFSEGWGPSVGWKDRGSIYQMGQKVSVPAGAYDDILVIKESAAGEKDAEQLKYYAPGVGNVRTGWIGTGAKVSETLELVRISVVDAATLAEVRRKALALEKSAYRQSKSVYGRTRPLAALQEQGVTAD